MKVFISHASTDTKLERRIAETLEESGFQVWDDTQILPGENWGEWLAEALRESEAMIVLLTPASLKSDYIMHEIGYALGQRNYRGRIIPVIAATPDQVPTKSIPWILQKFQVLRLPEQEKDEAGLRRIAQVLKDKWHKSSGISQDVTQ